MKTIKNLTAEQIRKSILQLAIQGKLVKQDPNDEPASVLVDKIYEEKKKLIAKGKIKREKVESRIFKGDDNRYYEKIGNNPPVCIEDELPFDIPDNWAWIRLKNTSEIYNGNSINETEKKIKYSSKNVGYDYISTKDISFDKTITYNNGVIIPFDTSFKVAPENKILLCIEGGSAGKKIAFTQKNVCFGNKLACFNTFIINDLYLFYILQTQTFINIFKSSLSGIIGGVSINNLKEFIIPLPPLKEQQRIVDKFEMFSDLLIKYNQLENRLTKLETEFPDKLKKSILQHAIEGKLVKQDPNDEPANVLLEKIRAEKKAKLGKKYIDSYIYKGDDNCYYEHIDGTAEDKPVEVPFDIPNNWAWTKISSIANVTKLAGFEYTKYIAPNIQCQGVPLIKGKNIQDSDIVYNFESYVSEQVSDMLPRSQITKKCILTPYVGSIGNIGIHNKIGKYHLGSNVGKIELKEPQTAIEEFIVYYLKSWTGYLELTKYKKATAQESISIEAIRKVYIPLPPLAEQQRIVDKINEIFANL